MRLPICLAALFAVSVAAASAGAVDTVAAKRAAILDYLRQLPGERKTLAGVQVNEYEVYITCTSADRLFAMTGRRPAILGLELMNSIAYPPYPAYLVDRALTQTARGGLVTMSWHARNPVEVCPRGEYYECAKKPMDEATLQAVLSPGTPEHRLWRIDVDAMAKVLRRLQRKGVVVLFRPYHEMNGDWFWWGRKAGLPRLWDALYDELAIRKKLDNLIWVWSVDREAPDAKTYFPLRHRPDVVGTDMYEPDQDTPKYAAAYANLAPLAGFAPFAITETGLVPSAAVMDAVNPAWTLLWGDMLNVNWTWNGDCPTCNKPEQVKAFFKLERIVTLEGMPAGFKHIVAAGVVNPHPLHKPNPICPMKLR